MKIEKITIVIGRGTDKIMLQTNFPSSLPKVSQENLSLDFDAEKDTGKEYCERNFPGIPIKVVNGRVQEMKFVRSLRSPGE